MKLILPLITVAVALSAFYFLQTPEVALSNETDLDIQFFKFIMEYAKSYKTQQEVESRFVNFKKNLGEISNIIKQGVDYDVAINKFADWSREEYLALLTYKPNPNRVIKESKPKKVRQIVADYINWVDKGKVAPVKDQGSCGSCWAFSAVVPLETAWAIKAGLDQNVTPIPTFSEQQIVDCSHEYGSMACDGGYMEGAMEHWRFNQPILESEYPYTGVEGTCKSSSIKSTSPIQAIADWNNVAKDSTGENIADAIQDGAVSVAIDASSFSFQFYKSGVLKSCSNTGLNHGVAAVGYGILGGEEYFLIKNSWGNRWGDKGFVKLKVSGNNCGLLEEPLTLSI